MMKRRELFQAAGSLLILPFLKVRGAFLLAAPVTQADYEPLKDCLSTVMWVQNGVQYRSNIMNKVGCSVGLHAHNFSHTARIEGVLRLVVLTPEGQRQERIVRTGDEVVVPAWHKHSFDVLETVNGIAEVLCFWEAG